MNTETRQIIDFRAVGLYGVSVIGRYNYRSPKSSPPIEKFDKHFEIIYLDKGSQTYDVGGVSYAMEGGDLLLIGPGEVHRTGTERENRGRLYWLICNAEIGGSDYLGIENSRAAALLEDLLRRKKSPLVKMKTDFRRGLEEVFRRTNQYQSRRNSKIDLYKLEHSLQDVLLEVMEAFEDRKPLYETRQITKTRRYITDNITDAISIDQLASVAGLSTSHFKKRFRTEIGVPPKDYINKEKIEHAKNLLLKEERAVTFVAYEMGFSSPQYFSTVFRKYTGTTPSEWITDNRRNVEMSKQSSFLPVHSIEEYPSRQA